jgi:ABC-type multidrug transport system, ATPase component
MIEAIGLTKRFGTLLAVDRVTLHVRQGEVLGFLGPNGAGKTTTMRMIAGFLETTAGSVSICGHDIVQDPIAARRCLGYLPEGAPLYGDMSARDFLAFVADVRGYSGAEKRRRLDRVADMVSLAEVYDRPIETLSKGFKRRVGLAQAMLHEPQVLILDEPTDGLDPNQKFHVRRLIRTLAEHAAIIVSTHILEEVDAVCTRAVIIHRGRIVADGTAEQLLARLPEHNSLVVSVEGNETAAARSVLQRFTTSGLTESAATDGCRDLRLVCGVGAVPIATVTQALHEAGVAARAIAVDRGRLDDVFRLLTTDAKAADAVEAY